MNNVAEATFEINYNDRSGDLKLEINGEKKYVRLYEERDGESIYYWDNYNKYAIISGRYFLNIRFVFVKAKETRAEDIYRLFYIYSKHKPEIIKWNFITVNFKFKSKDIKVNQIVFIDTKGLVTVVNNEINVDYCLTDIKNESNDKNSEMPLYFDFHYIYNYEDSNKDFRVKRIYLSLDSIDQAKFRKLQKYMLLNSMITIEDSFFDRVTSQIFTSIIINDNIIKEMINNKVRYCIFLSESDKKKANIKHLSKENLNIESFTFDCKTLEKLGKIVEYFIKGKADIIYIFNLNHFLYTNMEVDNNFDIQDYDYLYKENPPKIE